jgi:hypothetical protein
VPTSRPIISEPKNKEKAWSLKPQHHYLFGCYSHQSSNSNCHIWRETERGEEVFSFVEEGGDGAASARQS